jgi:hypothetical protein
MTTIVPGLYGLDSLTAFKLLQKNPQTYIDNFTKSDPQLATEQAYFNKQLATYKTPADLFSDTRAMNYLTESFGLGDQSNSMGLIKQVLTQDPTATGSLVSQLADPRYSAMANALRLDQGLTGLQTAASSGTLQTGYTQNEFEETLGTQDPALREAAYFARSSSTISTVYGVLGDQVLRDVVTKTLGLPAELAVQPIEDQAATVARDVDVTKFAAPDSSTASVSASQLASAQSDHTAIGTDLDINDDASKQVSLIQNTLSQLETNYSNLATITDPNGANADDIALQQNAVPQLVSYNELLNAGSSATGDVSNYLTTLQSIITQAGQSGADLDGLKQQFSAIVDGINDTINSASITNPDGASENILLNGSADTLTTTYNTSGDSVSINRYDLSGMQSLLNDANTAFSAVTDTTDGTDLNTALSRVLRSQDQNNAAATQIATDQTSMTNIGTPPQLAPYNNMLDTAGSAMDTVSSSLATLKSLITQAGQAGSDLTSIQAEFASTITSINSAISNATVTNADGTTTNILLNGAADTISTTFNDSNGNNTTLTVNRYDLSGLQSLMTTAGTLFATVTDSTDTTDLNAALTNINSGIDQTNATATQVATDQNAMANVSTSSGFFAASLNTTSLTQGQNSINDNIDRVSQIADLLNNIGDLATQAAAMDDGDDHSALESQFDADKTQLQSLIQNTEVPGLDNFLNGGPDQSYEIINGKTITVSGNGIDLGTELAGVFSGSLSDAASANSLYTSAIQGTNYTDRAISTLATPKSILDTTLNTYDPRGKLDNQVYQLQSQLSTMFDRAGSATSGINLLDPSQGNIQLSVLSTGTSLTFRSLPTFQSDITSALNNVISQLGNSDPSSIASALDDAAFTATMANNALTSDNRVATIEYGKLGSTIDALTPSNTDPSSDLYQTNTFTQKFIMRYLAANGSTSSSSASTNYLSVLFNSSSSSSSSTAISNIFSLITTGKLSA